jgi:cytochrome o ubiquinol oxidase subunit 2
MNGMATELYLAADRAGTFSGVAAHFNGDGFSDMTFNTQAMSTADFSQWVASVQANGPTLDEPAYRALLPQTSHVAPHTYRSVTPGLFDEIVSLHLPPGEGPRVAGRVGERLELANTLAHGD